MVTTRKRKAKTPPARPVRRRSARSGSAPVASIGDWLRFLGAELDDPDWIPVWPPDAFAFAAALLRRTGAYVGLVNGECTKAMRATLDTDAPTTVGRLWRKELEAALREGKSTTRLRESCPHQIKDWWNTMRLAAEQPLTSCVDEPALVPALASLCVASDEACARIGIGELDNPFLLVADAILINNDRRSFCLRVPVEKLAVLGKQHTPQRGCSIRSLTHNLALYTPTEIEATWEGPYPTANADVDVFNLLLLPWPVAVHAGDFRAMPSRADTRGTGDARHRYFDYAPPVTSSQSVTALAARVDHALSLASTKTDRIHAIVLPELALTLDEFTAIEAVAVTRGAILISGVRGPASAETNEMPYNACVIQPLGLTDAADDAKTPGRLWRLARRVQLKHHRWCLDRNQILQYELGSRLPASRDCWERIFIGQRKISFVTFSKWLTTCVLICEDLARQDPVNEVVRAVGPNLVFALLMDGPQLRNRWSSRYASVLAEDPGCSVLSLTSLGMSLRSRPNRDGDAVVDKSRTIALWRDAIYGEREIALGEGQDACVLSLVCRTEPEYTIDGRPDSKPSYFPVYAGMVPFSSEEPLPAASRYTRSRKP